MADVCKNYPESHIFQKNFVDIQRVIGRLVDELPEDGFTPSTLIPTGLKGQVLLSITMK